MRAIALIAFLAASSALAFEGETEASVSVSGTNARTSADLSTGIKEVDCDVAVYYRMGTAVAVATTNDAPRAASTRFYVNITNDGRRLAFITSGGTGTCRIYPVNVLASSRAAGALIFGGSGGSTVVTGRITSPATTATIPSGYKCVCAGNAEDVQAETCTTSGTTLTWSSGSSSLVDYICAAS